MTPMDIACEILVSEKWQKFFNHLSDTRIKFAETDEMNLSYL